MEGWRDERALSERVLVTRRLSGVSGVVWCGVV